MMQPVGAPLFRILKRNDEYLDSMHGNERIWTMQRGRKACPPEGYAGQRWLTLVTLVNAGYAGYAGYAG